MSPHMVWRMTTDDDDEDFSHSAPVDLAPGDTFEHVHGKTWTVASVEHVTNQVGTMGFATLTNGVPS